MITNRPAYLTPLASVLVAMTVMVIACTSISSTPEVEPLSDFNNVPREIVSSTLPLVNVWQFTTPLSINWYPVVERGTVLVRSQYGLQAVDGATGWKKWEYPFGRSGGQEFPIATEGNIVAVTGANHIRVLDVESGREVWRQKMNGSDIIYSIAVDSERVYAAGTIATSQATAYDIHSGTLLWQQDKLIPRSMFGAQLIGDNLYVFSGGRFILDKRSGSIIKQRDELAFNSRFPPVVSGQTIFIASLDGTLRALDSLSLKPRWTLESTCPRIIRSDFKLPTVVSSTVYASSGCSEVYAVDISTGKTLWTYRPTTNSHVKSSVAVLNGIGYVIYADGSLQAIDLRSGESVGSLQTRPSIVPGVVHGSGIVAGNGYLYAYFGGRTLFAFRAAK